MADLSLKDYIVNKELNTWSGLQTFSGGISGFTSTSVGLGNVDNTSDVNKPVSTATQTALNAKVTKVTSTDNALVRFNGTTGDVKNSTATVSDTGVITANRFMSDNTLMLNNYTTVNPTSNVCLASTGNDRDCWIYRDAADSTNNWGIYHRQIDSTVSGLPGNSIGFIGGTALKAYIDLSTGNGYFLGSITGSNITASGNVLGTATNITAYTINQNLGSSNQVTFDSVITSNNGNGTNIKIGDDVWLGNVNQTDTFRVKGVADANNGYVIFGSYDTQRLGRSGNGPLTYNGSAVLTAANFNTYSYSKTEVDSFLQGLDPKASVVVATTANITLSAPQTIDGIAVVAGDRVMVKNQTSTATNGIYIVAAGVWTRAIDMNLWAEVPGAYVFIEKGTVNADTGWVCISDQGGTLETTAITWSQFAGAGSVIATGTTSQYYRGDKTWATLDKTSVGLGNVDNTTDLLKPISTATQTALNAKVTKVASTDQALVRFNGTTGDMQNSLVTVNNDGVLSLPLSILFNSTDQSQLWDNGSGLTYSGTGGARHFRITRDGNVGIGTTAPTEKLHVVGNIQLGESYHGKLVQNGDELYIASNGDQAFRAGLGTNNGSGFITFKTATGLTGNTERMRITPAGNVLIGKTTDDGSNKLQVEGGAYVTSLTVNYATQSIIYFQNNSVTQWLMGSDAAATSNLYISNTVGGGQVVTILPNGNVGIGTNSINTRLHVQGSSNNTEIFRAGVSTANRNTGGFSVYQANDSRPAGIATYRDIAGFFVGGTNSHSYSQMLTLKGKAIDAGTTPSSGVFTFSARSDADGYIVEKEILTLVGNGNVLINKTTDDGINKLQVEGGASVSGNVGIGTSSPASKFEVSSGGGTKLRVTSTIDNNADIDFYTNSVYRGVIEFNSVGGLIYTISALPLTFGTSNTERMRIGSNGNVLIGKDTDDGSNKLQVEGSVLASGTVSGTNITTGGNVTGSSTFVSVDNSIAYGRSGLQFVQVSGLGGNTATTTNAPTNDWWHILRSNYANSTGYYTDLALPMTEATNIRYRRISGGTSFGWITVLDGTNYNSYSPTLTGTGATGSWGISVTGSSATATTATNLSGGTVSATTGYFSGNVGIGTSSPNQKLTVQSDISLYTPNGATGTTSILLGSSPVMPQGIAMVKGTTTSSGNGELTLHSAAGGVLNEVIRVLSNGNVSVNGDLTLGNTGVLSRMVRVAEVAEVAEVGNNAGFVCSSKGAIWGQSGANGLYIVGGTDNNTSLNGVIRFGYTTTNSPDLSANFLSLGGFNTTGFSVVGNITANGTVSGSNITASGNVTGSAGSVAWTGVTGKPSSLSGYGITTLDGIITEKVYAVTTTTGAYTIDLTQGPIQKLGLTGAMNITFPTLSIIEGTQFMLYVVSNGNAITWVSSPKWMGATAPVLTTTTSKGDLFSFLYIDAGWKAIITGQNY